MADYAIYAWVTERSGMHVATVAAVRAGADRIAEQHERTYRSDPEASAALGAMVRAVMKSVRARGDGVSGLSTVAPPAALLGRSEPEKPVSLVPRKAENG